MSGEVMDLDEARARRTSATLVRQFLAAFDRLARAEQDAVLRRMALMRAGDGKADEEWRDHDRRRAAEVRRGAP